MFGLYDLNSRQHIVSWVDQETNPGDWIKGQVYESSYTLPASERAKLKPGKYALFTAIANTSGDGAPHLKLAIKNALTNQGASILRKITVR